LTRLYNLVDSKILKSNLLNESFSRKTISFYRYFIVESPSDFRDKLYQEWSRLNCFGRIYIAREGINAQMSVPEHNLEAFRETLTNYPIFNSMPIKHAIEDNGKSFYKLSIKVKSKLVADGLNDASYDVTNVGKHLEAEEFHALVESGEHILVDMRNHYESEIGHFKGAICPETDTFRDEIVLVKDLLTDRKEEKILLYCTGGIRCEKASAYLKHHGFKDVNQLYGGILEYARTIKQLNLESHFIGKNFVFDERLRESVNGQIISHCHQCGKSCDSHVNCANNLCHVLFIQCCDCAEKFEKCCSVGCCETKNTTDQQKQTFRRTKDRKFGNRLIYRKSLLPDQRNSFLNSERLIKH